MFRNLKFKTLVALAVFGAASVATAAPVAIGNAGFELPTISPTHTGGPIQDWTQSPGTSGLFIPSSFSSAGVGFIAGVIGAQTAYINSGSIAQTLSSLLNVGTYTLSLRVGERADQNMADPEYLIELLAGTTVLGSTTQSTFATVQDGWITAQVSYSALTGNASLGQALGIRLARTGGGVQVNFDDVRLDFVASASAGVPEPGSLALVALAALACAAATRRRV